MKRKIEKVYIVIIESKDNGAVPLAFRTKKDRDGFIKEAKAGNQEFSFTVNKVELDVTEYACSECANEK